MTNLFKAESSPDEKFFHHQALKRVISPTPHTYTLFQVRRQMAEVLKDGRE
ncbi:MAG: hypothetical protein F6J89_10865 [Symploca sp. SIO1C4]|uniref:Uncharacterized protein n=1 Tax=Symploca sp. SIO1C4 TaxID=2607765 RepID=A0A6B3N927_9CYAN|nr:hypothetical protein [Symploca sp. SIO1C4]